MLVLSRKSKEHIVLLHDQTGERITVSVSEVKGSKVSLGISANPNWKILRHELLDESGKPIPRNPKAKDTNNG